MCSGITVKPLPNPAKPERDRKPIQRRDAEIAEISAEPLPRRRRGGMGWARRVGQAIALCGLSCFAASRQADRRQKAIVCPTGLDAESTRCGWVSGENTKNKLNGRGPDLRHPRQTRESCSFRPPCFGFSLRLSLRSLRLCVEYAFLFGSGCAGSGSDCRKLNRLFLNSALGKDDHASGTAAIF
jgi:hypothetical protein